jgi:hypothetical protein
MDANGYYARRALGMQLPNSHSLRYQNGTEGGTLGNGTSYVRVYHPTPSSWTLTPEDMPAAANPLCGTFGYCAAMIYKPNNGAAYAQYGTVERFFITLTSSRAYP